MCRNKKIEYINEDRLAGLQALPYFIEPIKYSHDYSKLIPNEVGQTLSTIYVLNKNI